MSGFEPHRRPNESKLEAFRDEITEMRAMDWPLRKIAEWLQTEKQCQVSYEAVRNFCDVRGLVKGQTTEKSMTRASASAEGKLSSPDDDPVEAVPASGRKAQLDRVAAAKKRVAKKAAKKKFSFDASQPLKVRRDQS